jgi:hypothetical protein
MCLLLFAFSVIIYTLSSIHSRYLESFAHTKSSNHPSKKHNNVAFMHIHFQEIFTQNPTHDTTPRIKEIWRKEHRFWRIVFPPSSSLCAKSTKSVRESRAKIGCGGEDAAPKNLRRASSPPPNNCHCHTEYPARASVVVVVVVILALENKMKKKLLRIESFVSKLQNSSFLPTLVLAPAPAGQSFLPS